ncbi:MAG: class III poly(R)-hydroxyalkanoic acid synthase subunit PhaC [Gammaproteobacteria bacterium]|nr:class III poly(R)-hydroxyalkanoic acid synthase subunit PhaC [Gammaproteobacteria bacterium]
MKQPADFVQDLAQLAAQATSSYSALKNLGEVSVGACERRAIYREQKVTLYRYQALTEQTVKRPLLIVYALVNRPYMADLQPGRSLIQGLLEQGIDVYLLDWGYPDGADRGLSLNDYINGYLDHCVDVVRRRCGVESINLLGICQGGTFSLCYTALHRQRVANLITTVTPVDFQTPGDLLSHLVRHIDIDNIVQCCGNVSGDMLNAMFLSLKPFKLVAQKYLDLLDLGDDEDALRNFMRMEKWIFDSPDLAGTAFAEFVGACYQRNALVKGELLIGGEAVDLSTLELPILNIYARDDHLVPPAASRALSAHVGSLDYQELEFPGGHVGIYVSGRARAMLPPAIGDWLRARD